MANPKMTVRPLVTGPAQDTSRYGPAQDVLDFSFLASNPISEIYLLRAVNNLPQWNAISLGYLSPDARAVSTSGALLLRYNK